jgi:N-glycosylase/DNA lyase
MMKINKLINLELTQSSGQTSQPPWSLNDEGEYQGLLILKESPVLIKLSQNNFKSLNLDYELPLNLDSSLFNKKSLEKEIYSEIVKIYNLDFDLDKFYKFLITDSKLIDSIKFCNGLRLFLAKNPFECIISSICSANNSINRWTKSISQIRYKWGEEILFPSGNFFAFPTPSKLSKVYENDLEEYEALNHSTEIECCVNNLKSCGVGYRAKYMKKTSHIFKNQLNYNDIFKMKYDEAFQTIIKIPGVGPKVADCILLYGFGFKEAFPSDVWIKRIISNLYFNGEDISANKVRDFGMDKFGDYAGYAQLYLFHYARKSGLMDKLTKI